jgi:hypothetical protein
LLGTDNPSIKQHIIFEKDEVEEKLMIENRVKIVLLLSIILYVGCASFNQIPDQAKIMDKVCYLMNKPHPQYPPHVWVVDNSFQLAKICTMVDKNSLKTLQKGYKPVGVCIIGDIFLYKYAISEATMAHEMAHYMGADEQEAERVAEHFSKQLVFRPRNPNSDWGSFGGFR